MIGAYILIFLAIFTFIVSLTIFIVLLVKKVKLIISTPLFLAGCFFVMIFMIAGIYFFGTGFAKNNEQINRDYFAEQDMINDQILANINANVSVPVNENVNAPVNVNVNKSVNTNLNTNTSVNTNTAAPVKKKEPTYAEQGKVLNKDYDFTLTVGKKYADKVRPVQIPSEAFPKHLTCTVLTQPKRMTK